MQSRAPTRTSESTALSDARPPSARLAIRASIERVGHDPGVLPTLSAALHGRGAASLTACPRCGEPPSKLDHAAQAMGMQLHSRPTTTCPRPDARRRRRQARPPQAAAGHPHCVGDRERERPSALRSPPCDELASARAEPRPTARRAEALRAFCRRHSTLVTVSGSLVSAAILALILAGRRDAFTAALSGAAAWVLVVTALLQTVALLARSEAWHLTDRGGGRQRPSAPALPRVEHAGPRQRRQRSPRRRRAHRGAAALLAGRVSPGADPDRRGVPDPHGRGGSGCADVVHARRPARAPVVASDYRDRRDRRRERRAAPACPAQGTRALARLGRRAHATRRGPPDGLRPRGGVRIRSSATGCCCTRSVSTLPSSTRSQS